MLWLEFTSQTTQEITLNSMDILDIITSLKPPHGMMIVIPLESIYGMTSRTLKRLKLNNGQ